jgi:tryptophan synthase beta subunit
MKITNYSFPTKDGYFGNYGGSFVPPELQKNLTDLAERYYELRDDPKFIKELNYFYKEYANRPSGLYFAQKLTQKVGGSKIYLKREDLNHTGAHKINNCLGQALLARSLRKKKLIAETGAGQHGVATATVAAYFGMKCDIYMGSRDIVAQKPNVYRIKLLGGQVIEVKQGQGTLKDAVDAALNAYVQEYKTTHYLLGSAVGPHPYPMLVRDFQKIIGEEAREQILKKEGKLPHAVIACIGGGSNAIGLFYRFITDETVRMIGVEPAGLGADTKKHGLSLGKGRVGIIHGFKTYVLQNEKNEVTESYSAASGLDYPGVGPEMSYLKDISRLQTVGITDEEAVRAFKELSRIEGIIPALESAHAIAYAMKYAKDLPKTESIIINLSGRGDKDVENVYEKYLKKRI